MRDMELDTSTGSQAFPQLMTPRANFDYSFGDHPLYSFYAKAKQRQWDASDVVDWSLIGRGDNPLGMPDTAFPLARSTWFLGLSAERRVEVKRHYQAWMVSQFLHGEQFGVLTASRISMEAHDYVSKFFAASQAFDEARHLECYVRLTDAMRLRYGLSEPFARFLEDVIRSPQLDLVYLGLQIIGEGIGLASFGQLRAHTSDPQVATLYGRILEDEARHVGFGRRFLKPLYADFSPAERAEREEFAVAACGLMDVRLRALEVWADFGLDPKDAEAALKRSASFRLYRIALFRQIIPIIRDLGLWSVPTQRYFESIGVAAYGDVADA